MEDKKRTKFFYQLIVIVNGVCGQKYITLALFVLLKREAYTNALRHYVVFPLCMDGVYQIARESTKLEFNPYGIKFAMPKPENSSRVKHLFNQIQYKPSPPVWGLICFREDPPTPAFSIILIHLGKWNAAAHDLRAIRFVDTEFPPWISPFSRSPFAPSKFFSLTKSNHPLKCR